MTRRGAMPRMQGAMSMTVAETRRQIADANRRRYEELRAAGQEGLSRSLPELTAPDAAPIAADAMIRSEEVPAGWYATIRLRRGEALRIVDTTGRASVAMIGWREEEMSERINCADTIKVQWSAALSKGRVILTDMGRVFMSLLEDTSGAHDVLIGGSTPASTRAAGGETSRNTHENFVAAAAKLGLGLRDIPPCVTFFAPVALDADGRFHWDGSRKRPRDFVDLRAEMNLVVVLSNCAHPLDPGGPAASAPVTLIRHRPRAAAPDDLCRTLSPEAARAFVFTDQLFA